jgi:hypothetical protein
MSSIFCLDVLLDVEAEDDQWRTASRKKKDRESGFEFLDSERKFFIF